MDYDYNVSTPFLARLVIFKRSYIKNPKSKKYAVIDFFDQNVPFGTLIYFLGL